MRYSQKDIIQFINKDGLIWPMRDIREMPSYQTAFLLESQPGSLDADEIASRLNVFGSGAEYQAYSIAEANAVRYIENGFTLNGIRSVTIPVVKNVLE